MNRRYIGQPWYHDVGASAFATPKEATLHATMITIRYTLFLLLLAVGTTAFGADEGIEHLRRELGRRLPNVEILALEALPYEGLFEVRTREQGTLYVNREATYAISGNLFDLKTLVNVTELRRQDVAPADFSKLPLDLAIVTVKGNGKRRLAVFSDPDCPFCREFQNELGKVTDVTIYLYLRPLEGLHPDAARKSHLVWCSSNAAASWEALMKRGEEPSTDRPKCKAPLGAIAELADSLNIPGTPSLMFESGRVVREMIPSHLIEQFLGERRAGG